MSPKKQDGYKKSDDEKKGDESPQADPQARSSNDPIFVPTSNVDVNELASAFASLTLEEQLVVAKSYETAFEEMKQRKSAIKTSKIVQRSINTKQNKENKQSKPKETHERYKKNLLRLHIRHEGGEFEIVVNASGKTGSIRREICKMLGLKPQTKLVLKHETVGFIGNMNKLIYSWGMADNSLIDMLGVMEEEDDDDEEEDPVPAMPIGTNTRATNDNDDVGSDKNDEGDEGEQSEQ